MGSVKHEWRKHEKDLYCPKNQPMYMMVPKMKYIVLEGVGNPNHKEFSDDIEVLYSLSYGIKMLPKKGIIPEGYFDYTVYPLEAIWRQIEEKEVFDKNNLQYRVMIRQPDFLTNKLLTDVISIVSKKKPSLRYNDIQLEEIEEGECVQMLHIGSYDDELMSFLELARFCDSNRLKRINEWHREIYLSDARKVEVSKLKTVLRFQVEQKV